jgi:hypothetical protein
MPYKPPDTGGGSGGAVDSVNGRTGAVVLTAEDVAAGQLPSGVLLPSGIVVPSSADISGILGTSGSKAAAGNDSRITGAAQKSSNLSDLANAATALANLGGAPVAGSIGGPLKTILRTSDASGITSNTTLASDSTLLFPVGANDIWAFMAALIFTAGDTAADVKIGWSVPTGCTMLWGAQGAQSNNVSGFGPAQTSSTPTALSTEAASVSVGSFNGTFGVNLQGLVFNGANPGNVNIQFAQATSSANALIPKKGSHLMVYRLA